MHWPQPLDWRAKVARPGGRSEVKPDEALPQPAELPGSRSAACLAHQPGGTVAARVTADAPRERQESQTAAPRLGDRRQPGVPQKALEQAPGYGQSSGAGKERKHGRESFRQAVGAGEMA